MAADISIVKFSRVYKIVCLKVLLKWSMCSANSSKMIISKSKFRMKLWNYKATKRINIVLLADRIPFRCVDQRISFHSVWASMFQRNEKQCCVSQTHFIILFIGTWTQKKWSIHCNTLCDTHSFFTCTVCNKLTIEFCTSKYENLHTDHPNLRFQYNIYFTVFRYCLHVILIYVRANALAKLHTFRTQPHKIFLKI